tara:strand:+ start:12921 stop:13907 length:987 start_codon:yes stop_codon:yes gene_type:complete
MAMIEKRGDKYRVLIRKKDMKPISKTFHKKQDAKNWMIDTESDIQSGRYTQDDSNFGGLIRRYVNEIGRIKPIGRSKGATLEALWRSLGRFKLDELDSPTLTNYAVERGVKPSTVMQDFIYIGVVLDTAESMWEAQPRMDEYKKAMKVLKKLGVIAESEHRDRRVSDEEMRIIAETSNDFFPMADLMRFAVLTAMRRGEQFGLLWKDIGDKGRSILVRQRKHPKKKRDERVPLLPEAYEIISRQPRVSEKIFPQNGKSVSHTFWKARLKAGIEDVRWHDLRHEGCTRLFELGFDMSAVSLFSGHKDMNMLKRYTHRSAVQVLDSLSKT